MPTPINRLILADNLNLFDTIDGLFLVNESGAIALDDTVSSGLLRLKEKFEMELFSAFNPNSSVSGTAIVSYIVEVDGVPYYWDGAAWSQSDLTGAQSNLVGIVQSNLATLPIDGNGSEVRIYVVFRHAAGGGETTTFSYLDIDYDYDAREPTAAVKCRVHASLRDVLGTAVNDTTAKLICRLDDGLSDTESRALRIPQTQQASFDANGFAELVLEETETAGRRVRFMVSFNDNNSRRTIYFEPCVIPRYGSVNLLNITSPTSEID
jgi:hypothetical protein